MSNTTPEVIEFNAQPIATLLTDDTFPLFDAVQAVCNQDFEPPRFGLQRIDIDVSMLGSSRCYARLGYNAWRVMDELVASTCGVVQLEAIRSVKIVNVVDARAYSDQVSSFADASDPRFNFHSLYALIPDGAKKRIARPSVGSMFLTLAGMDYRYASLSGEFEIPQDDVYDLSSVEPHISSARSVGNQMIGHPQYVVGWGGHVLRVPSEESFIDQYTPDRTDTGMWMYRSPESLVATNHHQTDGNVHVQVDFWAGRDPFQGNN